MPANPVTKAAILMVVLVISALVSWELYLRGQGAKPSYDDAGPLWADKRKMVYEPSEKATVFIGSSRIKYDLDIPTWEKLTGDHAIQLAIEGSCPRPLLEDLANDEKFKGKLVIDVTEMLFFSNAPPSLERPQENIKYYKDETPAQKVGFVFNHALESKLVFLDKNFYSMNSMLNSLKPKTRPGVFVFPDFPLGFNRSNFDRQSKMTDEFLVDTNQQNQVKGVWNFLRNIKMGPPQTPEELQAIMDGVKVQIAKIKARGGQVIFVRTPSSGPMEMGEMMGFARDKFWDKLLSLTGCTGIHYKDYPKLSKFICPEFSHLTPNDAVLFTTEFARILSEEKGWKFQNTSAALTINN